MNVASIISKAVKALPKTQGFSMPRMTFQGESLRTATSLLRIPENVTTELTRGLSNPSVEIALKNSAKARTNFAIAGIRIKDGDKVVRQGALSLTNPGAKDSIVKVRLTDSQGQHIKGFFDSGKLIDTRDISSSLSRKKGVISSQAEIGEAYAHNIRLYENELLNYARLAPNGEYIIGRYNQFNTDLRLGALDIANGARKVLRGEYELPKKLEKVFEKAEFAKVAEKPLFKSDFKDALKKFDIDKISKKINMDDFLKKHPEFSKISSKNPKSIKDLFKV